MNGYNLTVFAYGITGTGKTHTIFGDLQKYVDYNSFDEKNKVNYEMGICVHAVDYLFAKIESLSAEKNINIKISYLEIYNEQVIDLLVDSNCNLMIVEDLHKGIIVPDLTEYSVVSSKELIKLIIKGNSKRTMAATGENIFSSRSHAILQIMLEQRSKVRDTREEYVTSKFLLVDLAGSERSGLEKGIRTHEGKNINKSLLSLGNCINILSDKSKKGAFVPYRDSKLTRLLKDSLSGNIMSVMISCVSPSPTSYDETVNTLNYAMKARKIEKSIHKNTKEVQVHISQYKDIIDSLKAEIEQLKHVIKTQQSTMQNKNDTKNILSIKKLSKTNRDSEEENDTDAFAEKTLKPKENLSSTMGNYNNYNNSNNNISNTFEKLSNNTNKTLKNPITNIATSLDLKNISAKKNSLNNMTSNKTNTNMINKKKPGEYPKDAVEGSNLLMFSNNASLLSSQNNHNGTNMNNASVGNVNRSNGRASSSISRNNNNNNNTLVGQTNSNTSNISANINVLNQPNQATANNNPGKAVSYSQANNSKNSNVISYVKSNMKKSKKYAELSRNHLTGSFGANDNKQKEKEKNNNPNSSTSPKSNYQNLSKFNKENVKENYVNYGKFMTKNGEDDYDIEEFARNVEK